MTSKYRGTTLLTFIALLAAPALGWAASASPCGEVKCEAVKINLEDKPSLQNGARIFFNYCLSCHSAAYMRYNRVFDDLEMTKALGEEEVSKMLLFIGEKPGELMKAIMPKQDAKDWFGVAPPDLTLLARARTPEWIYTYMRSFYRDEKSQPSGWNNAVFQNVAMPHVLYEWQGTQRAVFKQDAKGVSRIVGFELERAGTLSKADYDKQMRDLTNFFVYMGEPAKLERTHLGVYVILFLVMLAALTYFLKKSYWKDVQ